MHACLVVGVVVQNDAMETLEACVSHIRTSEPERGWSYVTGERLACTWETQAVGKEWCWGVKVLPLACPAGNERVSTMRHTLVTGGTCSP